MGSAVSLVFSGKAADELAVVPLGRGHRFRRDAFRLVVVGILLIFIVLVVRLDGV